MPVVRSLLPRTLPIAAALAALLLGGCAHTPTDTPARVDVAPSTQALKALPRKRGELTPVSIVEFRSSVTEIPARGGTDVVLDWTASTDNVAPVAYRLQRNGVTISYRNAGSTLTYTDQQLVPGTAYSYTVKAIDVAGNESPEGSVVATTTGGAPVPVHRRAEPGPSSAVATR